MHDVTEIFFFEKERNLMKQIEKNEDKSTIKILKGLKCYEPGGVVSKEEGKKLAEEFNVDFFETQQD